MKLKIAHITNLTDARFFSAHGADYFGFCLDALNDHALTINQVKEIAQWLYEPILIGEFGAHQSKEEIEYLAQQLSLQEIEIPYRHTQAEEFAFQKFITISIEDIPFIENNEDLFVLKLNADTLKNEMVLSFIKAHPVFIEPDMLAEELNEFLNAIHPYGIQVACKRELQTGISDNESYTEILDILEKHQQ